MKVHIVQVNESLRDIARKYDLQVEDIIKNNLHISNPHNILPGMKLKLPILSEVPQEKFRENTINIQEFYPTIEEFKKFESEFITKDEKTSEEQVIKTALAYQMPNVPQQPQMQTNMTYPYMPYQTMPNPNYQYQPQVNYQNPQPQMIYQPVPHQPIINPAAYYNPYYYMPQYITPQIPPMQMRNTQPIKIDLRQKPTNGENNLK